MATWNPPAPIDYPAAGGPAPTSDTQRLIRLLYLREMGQWGSGESDLAPLLVAGTLTPAGVVAQLRAWVAAHPDQDLRAAHPQLVSWATAQLNGDALASGGLFGGNGGGGSSKTLQLVGIGLGLVTLLHTMNNNNNRR